MILDISKLDGDRLSCQVCIVGAGAAGITLALELDKEGVEVLLIAGGGLYEQSKVDRNLHKGSAEPPGSHEPLDENRCRVFGGATKLWGGRLVPFDAIDFERRSFLPLSGWPVRHSEITTHYPRAMALCETVPDEFRRASDPLELDLPDTLPSGSVETTSLERWSMPTDFGDRYRATLAASESVRVLMEYHALDLKLNKGLDRLESLRLVSRSGPPLKVAADVFVLATGGIENARLLLASRSQFATGLGNHADQVGRCYMSHISGTYGFIRMNSGRSRKPSFYRLAKDGNGVYSRRRFRLTDRAQHELKVGNVVGFPLRPVISDPRHRDAVLSFLYFCEVFSRNSSRRFPAWSILARHVSNCFLSHPLAWASLVRQLWLRSRRPRLPFFLPFNPQAQDAFYFQGEHAPNSDSRLVLGKETDEFGVPKIEARVRFSAIDFRTVAEFYREIDRGLRSAELGFVEYDELGLQEYLRHITSHFSSFAHHLGTTRMSADPRSGVVDCNCRVHSVQNLYVAGASVFPTSSHANPTMTIIALAMRLAEHLISGFRKVATAHAGTESLERAGVSPLAAAAR